MSRAHEILIDRVSRLGKLFDEDRDALRELSIDQVDFSSGHSIAHVGDRPGRSVLVMSGWAATGKETVDGATQIHAFHQSGDMPDLNSLHLTTIDAGVIAVAPCKVGFLRHDHLRVLCDNHPRIAAALWRSTLIDASIAREWITNIGQRRGRTRMAHLFCEVYFRSEAARLSEPVPVKTLQFPVTQAVLGQALGFSLVHVNRTLMELREDGLITFMQGQLKILNWEGLVDAAGFDPAYLHLEDEVSARYQSPASSQREQPHLAARALHVL